MTRTPASRIVGLLPLLAALAACADTQQPTAPDAPSLPAELPLFQEVSVCKTGPEGSWARFTVSATGGTLFAGPEVTITDVRPFGTFPAACQTVWRSTGPEPVTVTVTEVEGSPGTALAQITNFASASTVDLNTRTSTVEVSSQSGAVVIFANEAVIAPPEPPTGEQGCVPLFWLLPRHNEFWNAAAPGDTWGSIFADPGVHKKRILFWTVKFDRNTTLYQALLLIGKGEAFEFAQQAAAAWLNANSESLDYPLTPNQVRAVVNDAIANGTYGATGQQLKGYNRLECTIWKKWDWDWTKHYYGS